MATNSAYIYTRPENIKYALKDERQGENINVQFNNKGVSLNQFGSQIVINIGDIEWLRQVLEDIKKISEIEEGNG